MKLLIARWGNSLALRIPSELVRHAGLKEGEQVEASLTADGSLSIRTIKWDRQAFAKELESRRSSMQMGESVMEELRRGARY
jgi:antitoxin MazE